MIAEHERTVLTDDLPQESLKAGDVGVVVFVHAGGEAYEVEFLTLGGATVAVATVRADQIRPLSRADMAHARPLDGVDQNRVDHQWPKDLGRATVTASRSIFDQVWNSPEEDEAWRDL